LRVAGGRHHRRLVQRAGVASGLATAGLEFAWYGLATKVNLWRVIAANESIAHSLRPAHWVFW